MELFGTRPDPCAAGGPDNLPTPFHVYSMRQAIEEKFILDVLQNYTTYKLAFKLAHEGKDYDEKEVERSAAMKGIMGWVRLHPYNIAQKVQIVVEHFRQHVAPLLDGKGKAMVVVASRVEAVRWQLAIEKYIKEHGYRSAQMALQSAQERDHEADIKSAREELDALILFKGDMGAFLRLYIFLSQIFDYGNTALEKRAIFYKRLLPLLEFGREREGIDLSKVVLTHHKLKDLGKRPMSLNEGESPALEPVTEAGGGGVTEPTKAYLQEIIEQLNDLFGADTTDQDQLTYVNQVIKGKLLESERLRQQATNNSKEQFASSPDLSSELLNAIMAALDAHTSLSTRALNSVEVQRGMRDILLNHAGLWEALRERSGPGTVR